MIKLLECKKNLYDEKMFQETSKIKILIVKLKIIKKIIIL